jgi:hypothetical protein
LYVGSLDYSKIHEWTAAGQGPTSPGWAIEMLSGTLLTKKAEGVILGLIVGLALLIRVGSLQMGGR